MGDYMDSGEITPSLTSGKQKGKAAVSTNLLQHASRLGGENTQKLQLLM